MYGEYHLESYEYSYCMLSTLYHSEFSWYTNGNDELYDRYKLLGTCSGSWHIWEEIEYKYKRIL